MSLWESFQAILFKKQIARQQKYAAVIETIFHARQAWNNNLNSETLPGPVAELLALFWQEDAIALLLLRTAMLVPSPPLPYVRQGKMYRKIIYQCYTADLFSMTARSPSALLKQKSVEAHYMRELAGFIKQATPQCPPNGQARRDAIVVGVRRSLQHNMLELSLTEESFVLNYLKDNLAIGCMLDAQKLEDLLCDLLVATRKAMTADKDGPRFPTLEALRREVCELLRRLPPEQTPTLWRRLKDSHTSEYFWQVVDLIGEKPSFAEIPYLLNTLPALSTEGKAHVVKALHNIGDASALPALQQLAQDKTSSLAPIAAKAVKDILARSKGDVAQLLRASDGPSSASPSEVLLRPMENSVESTHPEELLRPQP